MDGWIMLHRRLLENPVIGRPKYCHLWVVLLLMACHKTSEFIWNNKKHQLKPGQLLTGRNKLAKQTGIPPSTVGRILEYLESEHQIEQRITSKFRIITIKNWQRYQGPKRGGQQTGSKPTASGHQPDTYKNDNNVKNEKKYGGLKDNVLRVSNTASQSSTAEEADDQNPYIR